MGKKYWSSKAMAFLLETTVKRWYADFKCARTDTNDAKFSGHPNLALNEFVANHKLKLCEIAEELKISESSVFSMNICQ